PIGGDHSMGEPDLLGSLGRDENAQHEEFGGMAQPNQSRQEPGRSPVGAGPPGPGKKENDLCALRRDPEIAGRCDDRAGAGHRAVESSDDRPAALPNGENEIAGEPGKLEQSVVVPGKERSDNVLDIATGAEGPAGSGDDDRPHPGFA